MWVHTHSLTTSHIGPSETRGIWIKFWLCQCQFSWCGIVLQSFKMLSLGKRGWRVYEISLVFLTTAHKSTIISRQFFLSFNYFLIVKKINTVYFHCYFHGIPIYHIFWGYTTFKSYNILLFFYGVPAFS